VAAGNERLYLKIYLTEDLLYNSGGRAPSSGQYKVRIATGTWVDEAPGAGAGGEPAGRDGEQRNE